MQLATPQRNFFDTFGFIPFTGLFRKEIAAISAEFNRVWELNSREHDELQRSRIIPFVDQSEFLSGLLDDPRVDELVTAVLGPDYNYMGSDGNFYVGETNWHSDHWAGVERFFKIAFYLEPLDVNSGCLRVIPGSHRRGEPFADLLEQQLQAPLKILGVPGFDVPCVPLATNPGDMICFDQNMKHSSFNGGKRRRMFSINFSQRWTPERLPALREYLLMYARLGLDCPFGDALLRTAGPRRQRHLDQVLENCGHLAESAAVARATLGPDRG